ncbi:MAG: helicase-related protein, partial [Bacillota bacterium]
PPAIMKITKEFQKDPTLIEIDKSQITIENIEQRFIDVPHANKKEALAMLLKYYRPRRAIIFCGTKKMADELTDYLNDRNVSAESIHSDIKQTQRTSTMRDFKAGKTTILIATDIAARGIDVSDVEYVINFDIPPNTEYYIHRIGRTGRAGKDGCSITICSSKREVNEIRQIAVAVKSEIKELPLPTVADIQRKAIESARNELEARLQGEANPIFTQMVNDLLERGYALQGIAEAALSLHYAEICQPVTTAVNQFRHEAGELSPMEARRRTADKKTSPKEGEKKAALPKVRPMDFGIMVVDIGSSSRVNANHIIGAITDRTGISGKEIGKIDIASEQSIVEIPCALIEQVVEEMKGCKICGKPTHTFLLAAAQRKASRPAGKASTAQNKANQRGNSYVKSTVKRSK